MFVWDFELYSECPDVRPQVGKPFIMRIYHAREQACFAGGHIASSGGCSPEIPVYTHDDVPVFHAGGRIDNFGQAFQTAP